MVSGLGRDPGKARLRLVAPEPWEEAVLIREALPSTVPEPGEGDRC